MNEETKGIGSISSSGASSNEGLYDDPKAEAEQEVIQQNTNGFQNLIDSAADALGLRSQEESQEIRGDELEETEKLQERLNQDRGFLPETTRAVVGGIAGAGEAVLNTADYLGDAIKQQFIDEDETENVLSEQYEAANFDFGTAENVTGVGKFAREAVTMLTLMRGARAIPGVGAIGTGSKAGLGARLGGEAARGAIADMIADSGDGNLSNMLEEASPGLKDTWLTALAHEDDDNIFIRKLKNAVEGGVFGLAVDGIGELYGAIRAGRKAAKAGASPEEAVDAAINARPAKDPGVGKRAAENAENSALPDRPGMYEPNSRATKTDTHRINDAIESQHDLMKAGNPENGGAKSILSDDIIKAALSTKNATEGITKVIRAAQEGANLEEITEGLRRRGADDALKTLPIVDDYVKRGTAALEELTETAQGGQIPVYMTPAGGQVVRALVFDLAEQIDDFARSAADVDGIKGDSFRQAEEMLDRIQVLARMDKVQSYDYATNLSSRKKARLNDKTLNDAAEADALRKTDELFNTLREKLRVGDPKAIAEFRALTDGMRLAGNDAEKILNFTQLFRRLGGQLFNSAMYNGHLSGPRTHIRNVVGGLTQSTLRPLTMAMGYGLSGNLTGVKKSLGAFHSFGESLGEAFSIARKSWDTSAKNSDAVRVDTHNDETLQILNQMAATAKTPFEKGVAHFMQLPYKVFASPWASWPTRAVASMDDGIRTLVARQELKSQVFEESMGSGAGFRFDSDRYAELVDQKIGINGEILDKKILAAAKNVSFQEDVYGMAKSLNEITQSNPVARFFLPFIRTPANMIAASFDYVPGWNRAASNMPVLNNFTKRYKQAMEGSDENLKAIYRGREALGIMLMSSTVPLALTGHLTGAGPQDPDKRKLWLKNNQPNSIKIGGKWISYQAIEPLNTILSMTADVAKMATAAPGDAYDRSLAQAAYTIAAAVTQKSYFQGLIQFTKIADITTGQWQGALISTAADLAGVFVPQRQLLMGFDRMLTPGKQQFDNQLQRELASIVPGTSALLGANQVDIFSGQDIADANDNIFNMILPINVNDANNDRVVSFLAESGVSINTAIGDNLKGLELTADQKRQLQLGMAQYGLRDNLERLMDQKWFKEDHANWLASGQDLVEDERWYRAVKREFQMAQKSSAELMMKADPTFRASYLDYLQQRQNRKTGNYSKPENNRMSEINQLLQSK